ncbi:MAG: Flp pilus assembly complex ATPase component TadA [Clostridia bacterium]|nr:Flp pilus assembly complex ATPase component TadA [Clostridia bacterium]
MDNAVAECFDSAIRSVEPQLKRILKSIDENQKKSIFEIRLRSEKPVVIITAEGTRFVTPDGALIKTVSEDCVYTSVEAVKDTFNRFCCYSVHSHISGIVRGYITMEGGHRAGITGTAVCDIKGNITSLRDVSGINIRVAREIYGTADRIVSELYKNELQSVIIAGPPASGKTTVLRDAVRQLSSADRFYKISLIDERQELASVNSGIAQKDVGINVDILDCYPKTEAMMIALKTLSPEIIALDEVGDEKEIDAIRLAVNTGVKFILTMHASDYNELLHRPQIQRLIETYSFNKLVMLKKEPIGEIAAVYDTKELYDEIIRCRNNLDLSDCYGLQNMEIA